MCRFDLGLEFPPKLQNNVLAAPGFPEVLLQYVRLQLSFKKPLTHLSFLLTTAFPNPSAHPPLWRYFIICQCSAESVTLATSGTVGSSAVAFMPIHSCSRTPQ